MPLAKDLLQPSPEEEKRKHEKKRLVQSPSSYLMDVKSPRSLAMHKRQFFARQLLRCPLQAYRRKSKASREVPPGGSSTNDSLIKMSGKQSQ